MRISYAKNLEDIVLARVLGSIERGFYVEIEAQNPMSNSLTRYFYEKRWRGLNITSSQKNYQKLQIHRMWDTNRCIDLNIQTLSSIFAEFSLTTVHFFKMAANHEEIIFQAADFSLFRPWIVLISSDKTSSHLLKNGYQSVYFDGETRFYVAIERSSLMDSLFYPPLSSDNYIRYSDLELKKETQTLKEKLLFAKKEANKYRNNLKSASDSYYALLSRKSSFFLPFVKSIISKSPYIKKKMIWLRDKIMAKKHSLSHNAAICALNLNQLSSQLDTRSEKNRLILISPMPPIKSGIADYSLRLTTYLLPYYDVVIVSENETSLDLNVRCMDAQTYLEQGCVLDRHLYHFGNSSHHIWMLPLLHRFPGTIVLHDVFLGNLYHALYKNNTLESLIRKLFDEHGYDALKQYTQTDLRATLLTYSMHTTLCESADGVLVHSDYAKHILFPYDGTPVPFPKDIPVDRSSTQEAKIALGISPESFVVCSFGFIGPTKCSKELLLSWEQIYLSKDMSCKLIFVGELPENSYGEELLDMMNKFRLNNTVVFTGYCDAQSYINYLCAADLVVQLRVNSRGETSAAAFDALSYGKPLIVNANGSMSEFPKDTVVFLPDDFSVAELALSLCEFKERPTLCLKHSLQAQEYIMKEHNPALSAQKYYEAIETNYTDGRYAPYREALKTPNISLEDLIHKRKPARIKRLFVDVSDVASHDLRTGIQRVVRSIFKYLQCEASSSLRIEPIRLIEGRYHHAHTFMSSWLELPFAPLEDEPVLMECGDSFLGLDLYVGQIGMHPEIFKNMQEQGINIWFVVYDILPIHFPHFFPPSTAEQFEQWLRVVTAYASGVACISVCVANELQMWLDANGIQRTKPLSIKSFLLGADIANTQPTKGITSEQNNHLLELEGKTIALMVGTVEPRKGHAQVLEAFELLWEQDKDITLVVVGKKGWMVDALAEDMQAHQKRHQKLFWFKNASDEFLELLYSKATFLLAASKAEGFGLPLIEAAQHKVPIIARDIPVFREALGNYAFYFKDNDDITSLAGAIIQWLDDHHNSSHPIQKSVIWSTWEQSAKQLFNSVIN